MIDIGDEQHALHLLHQMLRIRRFEEKCAELNSAERIRGFLHLSIGEEAVSAGAFAALRAEDSIVTTYREHGHALARGLDVGAVMAEMFRKQNGLRAVAADRCTCSAQHSASLEVTRSWA